MKSLLALAAPAGLSAVAFSGEGTGGMSFDQLDANRDGVLSRAEVEVDAAISASFEKLDTNADGQIDSTEFGVATK